jgi:hydrogenase maturation protease
MSDGAGKVLLIGYGNPGRLDDGLGPALADAIAKLAIPGVTVDAAYQLNVEDAAAIAEHDVVVFADADLAGPEPYWFRRIEPKAAWSFSTHSIDPDAVLGMAQQMFKAKTEGYILGIRGYDFDEFGERLSDRARGNLVAATAFIEQVLRDRSFQKAAGKVEEFSVTRAALTSEVDTCKTENT